MTPLFSPPMVTHAMNKKTVVVSTCVKMGLSTDVVMRTVCTDSEFMDTIRRHCIITSSGDCNVDIASLVEEDSVKSILRSYHRRTGTQLHPSADEDEAFPVATIDQPSGRGATQLLDHSTSITALHGQSSNRYRRPRVQLLSDEDLLDGALKKCSEQYHALRRNPNHHQLKTFVVSFGGRDAGISTAFVAANNRESLHVSFFWQVNRSPPKIICVTITTEFVTTENPVQPDADVHSNRILIDSCTCSPFRKNYCVHSVACLRNTTFTSLVRHTLLQAEVSPGEYGCPIETGDSPILRITRQHLPSSLLSPASQSAANVPLNKSWETWLMFDMRRSLFVPLVKRLKRYFQCGLCHGSPTSRGPCTNESYTRDKCLSSGLYDCSDNESSISQQNNDPNPPRQSTGISLDSADSFVYCPSFTSRPVLPCSSETKLTDQLYKRIEEVKLGDVLSVVDAQLVCQHCKKKCNHETVHVLKRSSEMVLLTLSKGPFKIQPYDWRCVHCL